MSAKKRVYVYNVPFGSAENDVAKVARNYGSVRHVYLAEATAKCLRSGALNAGYGFVEFGTPQQAEKFIESTKTGEVILIDAGDVRSLKAEFPKKKKAKRVKPKKGDGVRAADSNKVDEKVASANSNVSVETKGKLDVLPLDIWNRIFTFLDLPNIFRLRLVNRQMLRIVEMIIANMVNLDLTSAPVVLSHPDSFSFASKFTYVDSRLLRHVFSKSNRWLSLRQLKLNSNRVTITPKTVKAVAEKLRTLEELSIKCHRAVNNCFRTLFKNNRKLRRLNIRICSGSLSLKSIRCLLKSCTALTHITIDMSGAELHLDKGSVEDLANESSIHKFFDKVSGDVRFLSLKLDSPEKQKVETMFCRTFPHLVIAHLTSMPLVPMNSLRQLVLSEVPVGLSESIWKSLPCLESLIIDSKRRPDSASLSFLSSSNAKISELALRACNLRESDLQYIPPVKHLDIQDNCSLTDDHIKTYLNGKLYVERLGLRGLCQITSELLRFIAVFCPRLKVLNISDCPKIDNDSLQTFINARSSAKGPQTPLTIIAPGCPLTVDSSFNGMITSKGIMLLTNWADNARIPIVGHFDPSAIEDRIEEHWPFSNRNCGEHRSILLNELEQLALMDLLEVEDSDGDDFDHDDDFDDDFDDEPDFG